MFRIRAMLLMGMIGLLFACSSTNTSRTDTKNLPHVVCKLVGVENDDAIFVNRRTDPDGKVTGVWTNRVPYKTLAVKEKSESPIKFAVDEFMKELHAQAEDGDPGKQYELGLIYYAGKFVTKDDAQALMWYLRAGMQGHGGAQHELGTMYQYGQSAPKDFVEAYKWYDLSANGGERWSEENRKALAGYLTGPQLAEAKKRVAVFKPIKESGK